MPRRIINFGNGDSIERPDRRDRTINLGGGTYNEYVEGNLYNCDGNSFSTGTETGSYAADDGWSGGTYNEHVEGEIYTIEDSVIEIDLEL